MKKLFLSLLSFFSLFFITSCGNADKPDEGTEEEETTEDLKPVVERELIEGVAKHQIVTNGVLLTAPATIKKDDVEFVFAYFGLAEDNPIKDEKAPVYTYGQMEVASFSYLLKNNPIIKADEVKPYYTLKKYFYFDGFKKEGGVVSELKKQEKLVQPYYTNLDANTLIPSVTFDRYTFLDYYLTDRFEILISTFGELEEATKEEKTIPHIFALEDLDPTDPIDSFDVYQYLTHFNIQERLDKYVLTRDKEHAQSIFDGLNVTDLAVISKPDLQVYYSEQHKLLAIRIVPQIKYKSGNVLVPLNVREIDLSVCNNKVLLKGSYSFKAFFMNSTASVIDLTGNNPLSIRDMSHMFSRCTNLEVIKGFETLDTSFTRNMSYLFYNTKNLNAVNLSNLDTTKVIDTSHMFHDTNLKSLDVSHFVTKNTEDFKYMFENVDATNLVLPMLNFSSVYDIRGMFKGVTNLADLDLSDNNFANIDLFDSFLKNVNVNNLYFSNITFAPNSNFASIFDNATISNFHLDDYSYKGFLPLFDHFSTKSNLNATVNNLTLNNFKLDVTNNDTSDLRSNFFTKVASTLKPTGKFEIKYLSSLSNATLNGFFRGYDASLYNFDLADLNTWDVSNVANMSYLFYGYKTNLNTLGLALNWDLKNVSNLDRFIDTSNFTSLSLNSLSASTPTSAFGAFSAQDLETLELANIDFTNAPLTVTTVFTRLKSITASNLPIDYLVNITDLNYNTNKTRIEKLVVDSVTDNDPKGLPISLNNYFNFSNIKEFKLDNLNIPRIKSYNSLFKGFTYAKGAKISAKYWVLNNPDLDLTSMFEGVNLFYDLGHGFTVSDNANMTNMFKNATLSAKGLSPLDLDSWGSTTSSGAKINVKTYTNMFEGVSTGIHEQDSLNLNKFMFDTTSPQTIATSMNVSAFSYNNTTDSHLKLFAPILKTLIDNGTLKRLSFDDLTVTTSEPTLFKVLPFYIICKLNKDHLSFRNLRFEGANTYLVGLFSYIPYSHPHISTIDLTNVSNISGMFLGAVIDQPLHLNLKQDVTAEALFAAAIINEEITQVTDPSSTKFKFSIIDRMFSNVLVLRPLDLSTLNIDNPASAKEVFEGFRFNDGDNVIYPNVKEEDRVLNITGWDFKNYKDNNEVLERFFNPSEEKPNNIYRFVYNKTDVFSFIALRDQMKLLSYFYGLPDPYLHYWDFEYLYLHDTHNHSDGSQYKLIDTFASGYFNFSHLDTKGDEIHLFYFLYGRDIYRKTSLENTRFSTWHFPVKNLEGFLHSDTYPRRIGDVVDLSGFDVTNTTDYRNFIWRCHFITLITNNWNMSAASLIDSAFAHTTEFEIWDFSKKFTAPKNDLSSQINCWEGSKYNGIYPDHFPFNHSPIL